ncbi:MAG: phosphatidate cytidylyltransferase [Holosporales bacterium]|jgi:phosphatidate cytidylyltransferase|nr:phosphatidate cytidylyltransferase [Holosporales bacterium]
MRERTSISRALSEVILRAKSSVILVGVLVTAVLAGGVYFYACASIITGGIIYEWMRASGLKYRPLAAIGSASLMFMSLLQLPWSNACAAVAFLAYFWCNRDALSTVLRASVVVVGAAYILVAMRLLGMLYCTHGKMFVLWMFMCIWLTDTGAFFAGRYFKGAKIAPKISPNKAWSGFFGGVGTSVLVGSFVASFVVSPNVLHKVPLLALAIATFGTAGDLLESACKRYFGVKDMGSLIPGHGGMADRFDSTLLVAIVCSLIFWLQS